MIQKTLTIRNKLGLHARAAGAMVKLASTFSSNITIEKDGTKANSKSIMGLMLLAAARGSRITLSVEGGDQKEAMSAMENLIRKGFHEE